MPQTNISLNEVIKGLERCTSPCPSDCWQCSYKGNPDDYPHCVHNRLQPDALALLKSLSAFKSYFDNLYGEGFEVANYHLNDETEEFDNFYADAMWEYEHA